MNTALHLDVEFTRIDCGKCGSTYAINESYRKYRVEHGGYWNCPYCQCSWGYGDSALKRKEAELAAEKKRHSATLARLNETIEAANKEAVRLKKRTEAGMCTCCNRTFQNLARHMATKHADKKVKA
jgi:hypothetical protein